MPVTACKERHSHPIHLHLTSGYAWLCLACEKQLAGKPMPGPELEAMIDFIKVSGLLSRPAKARTALIRAKENEMSATVNRDLLAAHANGLKSSIHALEVQVTIVKQLLSKMSGEEEEETETPAAETEEEEEDFGAKPKKSASKKAAAAAFGEEEESEETEEEEEPAPKKTAKPKKVTADDVNDACKAHAKENGIKVTKALLMKKFKTQSISEIAPEKYPAVIAALEA